MCQVPRRSECVDLVAVLLFVIGDFNPNPPMFLDTTTLR